jgi:hypothetical protein
MWTSFSHETRVGRDWETICPMNFETRHVPDATASQWSWRDARARDRSPAIAGSLRRSASPFGTEAAMAAGLRGDEEGDSVASNVIEMIFASVHAAAIRTPCHRIGQVWSSSSYCRKSVCDCSTFARFFFSCVGRTRVWVARPATRCRNNGGVGLRDRARGGGSSGGCVTGDWARAMQCTPRARERAPTFARRCIF